MGGEEARSVEEKEKVDRCKRIVSCKLRIHGLSAHGRNVSSMLDNAAVTAKCPNGQNESSEYARDAYAGNVFPRAFCFSWLEYRI